MLSFISYVQKEIHLCLCLSTPLICSRMRFQPLVSPNNPFTLREADTWTFPPNLKFLSAVRMIIWWSALEVCYQCVETRVTLWHLSAGKRPTSASVRWIAYPSLPNTKSGSPFMSGAPASEPRKWIWLGRSSKTICLLPIRYSMWFTVAIKVRNSLSS